MDALIKITADVAGEIFVSGHARVKEPNTLMEDFIRSQVYSPEYKDMA